MNKVGCPVKQTILLPILHFEGKYPFNQLLHSFEVHYPIRFPRFTTVG